jgi:lactoylglutathione lyase
VRLFSDTSALPAKPLKPVLDGQVRVIEMKIEHIAIWTKNLEKLKEFYEKYFDAQAGTKYQNRTNQFESYFLTFESGARLELMSMSSIPSSKNDIHIQYIGLIHIAFSAGSESKVNSLTKVLKLDGYTVIEEPRRTGDGYYESIVLDPDGNRIEITI